MRFLEFQLFSQNLYSYPNYRFLPKSSILQISILTKRLHNFCKFSLVGICPTPGYSKMSVWLTLVKYWSNSTIIKTVSIDQRTQVAMIICTALDWLTIEPDGDHANNLHSLLSKGLEFHLHQPSSSDRDVGMLTAQLIINKLNMAVKSKLNFQLHDEKFETKFKSIIAANDDPVKAREFWDEVEGNKIAEKFSEVIIEPADKAESDAESLDSDDLEFEPFDWTEESKSKYAPKYILEAADILSGSGVGIIFLRLGKFPRCQIS